MIRLKRKSLMTAVLLVSVSIISLCIATDNGDIAKEFDCAAAFDFVASLAAPSCPRETFGSPYDSEISAAIHLLMENEFVTASSFNNISIKFCPLTQGLGLVRRPNAILIDDGLRLGSPDTLAEILIHELMHIKQMQFMGRDAFKCKYIDELLACGGCMDKNHALEAPAYMAQARVRDSLLQRWLEKK